MNKYQKVIVSITKKEYKQNVIDGNYDILDLSFRVRRYCTRRVFKKDSVEFLCGYKNITYKI